MATSLPVCCATCSGTHSTFESAAGAVSDGISGVVDSVSPKPPPVTPRESNTGPGPRFSLRISKHAKRKYSNTELKQPEQQIPRFLNRSNAFLPSILKLLPNLLETHALDVFNLARLYVADCPFIEDPNSKRDVEKGVMTMYRQRDGDVLGYITGLLVDYLTWKSKYNTNEYVIKLTYFKHKGKCLYLVADPKLCMGAICNNAATLHGYTNNAVFYQDPTITHPLNPFLVQIKATRDLSKNEWVHIDYGKDYTLPSAVNGDK